MGKSRLALEAAHRNAWRFPGSVTSVQASQEQAPANTPLARLADTLDLAKDEETPAHALLFYAQNQPTLFILDNLESLPQTDWNYPVLVDTFRLGR